MTAWLRPLRLGEILDQKFEVIYYDQRIRLERFDIEQRMNAAGMMDSIPAHAPAPEIVTAPLEESQA